MEDIVVDLTETLGSRRNRVFGVGRPCDWQTEVGMPWNKECGARTTNLSGWCDEHEQDALDLYPELPLPIRPEE